MESQAVPIPLIGTDAQESVASLLADLNVGEKGFVSAIETNGLLRRRLLDLGFVPGAEVKKILESPTGDPALYRVRGSSIALRRADAAMVGIQPNKGFLGIELGSRPVCSMGPVCGDCASGEARGAGRGDRLDPFIVALAGNPNTGKTTLFNALTGLRQHVGNWPGKTVVRAEGSWTHKDRRYRIVDLPGAYSLLSTSTDEEIARDYLLFGAPDCTVAIVDSTCLERNLNLVFQILEITNRVVVCVNLLDEARRKGLSVDLESLEEDLGVPVVGTTARSGAGLETLKERIAGVASGEIVTSPRRIPYELNLQAAIDELLPLVKNAFPDMPNARWIAMRLIEGADVRLREEIESGVLADLSGRIGESSLGGFLSPITN